MRATKARDTEPELALRSALHAAGLRFRVDKHVLQNSRRRADVVFGSCKVAVFVDGCFWHSCPVHASMPKLNGSWWAKKLACNKARDVDTNRLLSRAGWAVIRVWEHECPDPAAARVIKVVRTARNALALAGRRLP